MRKIVRIPHPEKGNIALGLFDDKTHVLLRKVKRETHLHRYTNSYMYYSPALPHLRELGVERITIEETDTGNAYTSKIGDWSLLGRPWRDQIGLPLEHFSQVVD